MRCIRSIDIDEALAMPGVLAVLTGADFLADGIKPIPHKPWSQHPAEITLHEPGRRADRSRRRTSRCRPTRRASSARAVAMVVAETVKAAKDGAELIAIDYEVLPAVSVTVAAARQDAPIVHEPARSNV